MIVKLLDNGRKGISDEIIDDLEMRFGKFRMVLEQGDGFGERCFLTRSGRRTSSIYCLTDVECLVLTKEIYRTVNKLYNTKMILKKKYIIETIPGFDHLPQNETTETLLFHFQELELKGGDIITEEGEIG